MCISFLQRMGLFLGFSRAPTPSPFRIAGILALPHDPYTGEAIEREEVVKPDLDSRTGFRHREWQKC